MRPFVAASMLALTGCATVGTDFDPAVVESIQPGTTQAQVVGMLGQPTARTRLADGSTQLMWSFGKSQVFGSTTGKATILQFDKDGRYTGVVSSSETVVR